MVLPLELIEEKSRGIYFFPILFVMIIILHQGWPSFLCKAPTLLPTRVGCAINVGQGWPTFSVHAPKFFATQTFIAFHCSQTCSNIFILWSQNKAIFRGDLHKKKKKKKKRSSPVSLHLFHHFWLKYATKREANQVRTFFFFFGDVIGVTNFSARWKDTYPNCPKNLKPGCATSKHAMRQIWRNAPRLATPVLHHDVSRI